MIARPAPHRIPSFPPLDRRVSGLPALGLPILPARADLRPAVAANSPRNARHRARSSRIASERAGDLLDGRLADSWRASARGLALCGCESLCLSSSACFALPPHLCLLLAWRPASLSTPGVHELADPRNRERVLQSWSIVVIVQNALGGIEIHLSLSLIPGGPHGFQVRSIPGTRLCGSSARASRPLDPLARRRQLERGERSRSSRLRAFRHPRQAPLDRFHLLAKASRSDLAELLLACCGWLLLPAGRAVSRPAPIVRASPRPEASRSFASSPFDSIITPQIREGTRLSPRENSAALVGFPAAAHLTNAL